jgi:hypothetical protein
MENKGTLRPDVIFVQQIEVRKAGGMIGEEIKTPRTGIPLKNPAIPSFLWVSQTH